jgi:hypothetical protein
MPTRLPGRRAAHRGGALKPLEREAIEKWFVQGLTVVEVYARCLDEGIQPPVEQVLYRILNSATVQEGLRKRREKESKRSIASIVRRTASREKLLGKIERTVDARADAYAELIPGGEEGLVVFVDRKSVLVGKDSEGNSEYETVDVYKTDGAIIEQWRGVLSDQEKSDAALLKNLRGEEREDQEADLREQSGELRELERKALELELEKKRLEVEKLRAELEAMKAAPEGTYQAPSFPEVIVEALPVVQRPESATSVDAEEDEGATPEIPLWGEEP